MEQFSEYIRDIRDIRSSNRSESNPEIQSLNMFKSGILNIRKVRSESNIKLFEYFGQPISEHLNTQNKNAKPQNTISKLVISYKIAKQRNQKYFHFGP